jgi:hypothetical protein
MRQVSLEAMESLLVRYKGRYTAVVGFQPTGWTHTAGGSGGRAVGGQASRASSSVKGGKRLQRGTVVLYKVRSTVLRPRPAEEASMGISAPHGVHVSNTHASRGGLCDDNKSRALPELHA